jgi:hypothetical protein
MSPFTPVPTSSAADELAHLLSLRAERGLALLAQDADLAGDIEVDIEASMSAFVGLAVTEIASLRGELGARAQG